MWEENAVRLQEGKEEEEEEEQEQGEEEQEEEAEVEEEEETRGLSARVSSVDHLRVDSVRGWRWDMAGSGSWPALPANASDAQERNVLVIKGDRGSRGESWLRFSLSPAAFAYCANYKVTRPKSWGRCSPQTSPRV